ncbi:hypothetical protein BV509_08530 [Rhodovulum sulfidophilum]|uniref:DsrE/DsrF/DsrH-like protein n=1 Tax=Rhodovulum visakhapatnamense TaxID=364297 RepID=A0A4R8FUU5_9RHOB|nr:hypothetical protein [Rhodovulum visakhapatnamense]MBL3569202.1 hypothetical protein [Rhodovulum visakhapatnamense]MBL3578682.1 hypothetical protein [Rhodovulum visakhapatnamense]OLS44383.1 hypothetical protein BV509_08530 [Rhodovulum sulfidophilum]TDX27938.1 hypothetical protein EV657_11313 [Rhodovulum visakhapatnamense]
MTPRKTALIAAVALALAAAPAAARDVRTLVTVLTDPNPQTQLMGLVLTLQALERGAAVRVLLCGPAGDIALADPPAAATEPQPPAGMSPQAALAAAIGKGARAEVCAIYLPGRAAGPEALIEGVGVAKPDAMARDLLDRQSRVWSF